MGQRFVMIPILAALGFTKVSIQRRLFWCLLSVLLLYVLRRMNLTPEQNFIFDHLTQGAYLVPNAAYFVIKTLIKENKPDYLTTLILGLIGVIHIKQNKVFWLFLFLFSFTTASLSILEQIITSHSFHETIRARRFLTFSFVCLIIFVKSFPDLSQRMQRICYFIMLIGILAIAKDITKFFFSPSDIRSLPFTESAGDFFINKSLNSDAFALSNPQENSRHFIVYGFNNYAENTTDPVGFPQRILLKLGPQKFNSSIRFIDASNDARCKANDCTPLYNDTNQDGLCKHASCLPFLRIDDVTTTVNSAIQENKAIYLHIYKEPNIQVSKNIRYDLLNQHLLNFATIQLDLGLKNFKSYGVLKQMK